MKKLSIVLLALLFVTGAVFAAELSVSGEASASVEYDMVNDTFGLVNDSSTDVDFGITLGEGSAASEGEGDIYAVIEGSASIVLDFDAWDIYQENEDDEIDIDGNDDYDEDDEYFTPIIVDAAIDSARIYAGDLWVDILGAPTSFSNAVSPLDKDDDDDLDDDASALFGDYNGDGEIDGGREGSGLTIGYQDFTFGVDFFNYIDAEVFDYLVYGKAVVPSLPEGISAEAMAAISSADGDAVFSAGFNGAYEMDGMSFTFAGDFVDNFDAFDLAATADVSVQDIPVAVALYLGDSFDATLNGTVPVSDFDVTLGIENSTEWDAFAESLTVSADVAYDAITAGLSYGFGMDTDGLTDWSLGYNASYDMDMASVSLEGSVDKPDVDADEFDLPLTLTLSSSSIINNATLALAYECTDLEADDAEAAAVIGAGDDFIHAVTASVTVSL